MLQSRRTSRTMRGLKALCLNDSAFNGAINSLLWRDYCTAKVTVLLVAVCVVFVAELSTA